MSLTLVVCAVSQMMGQNPLPEDATQNQNFSPADFEFFESKVRPLLITHCLQCHGENPDKIRGGLRLTSRADLLKGGDSGSAMVPGDVDASLLIQSVRYQAFEMPPSGPLEDFEIDILAKWIEMGAPDPRDPQTQKYRSPEREIQIEQGKNFWAFRHRQNQKPPECFDSEWAGSPIDNFILRKLESAGIAPVKDASRETLIRRVYLALIGLPPTVKEIDAFLSDRNEIEQALATVVDRLLASKHFGERWGRHWLDVARFAESSGGGRSLMFPDAWRFRDYVIESFNSDKPFDQFVREQIAGDLLPYDSQLQKNEQIVATGFLALGPTNYEQQDKELLRMEVVDEQIDTMGRAFLGLTLGCARCHDHKFDPIPTTDYYALAGIFGSTQSLIDGNVSKYVERSLASEQELEIVQSYRNQVTALNKQLSDAQEKLQLLGDVGSSNGSNNKSRSSQDLDGIVVDDRQAKLTGDWTASTHSGFFVDGRYLHDADVGKGEKQAVFEPIFTEGGRYEVRLSFSSGGNRASNVPVEILHQDGLATVTINQSREPTIDGLFISLGTYRFEADNFSSVTISTKDTDGHVIIDAVQFLKVKGENESISTTISGDSKEKISSSPKADSSVETRPGSAEVRRLRLTVERLEQQLIQLKKTPLPPTPVAMSVIDAVAPQDGHLHIRGSAHNLGPIVPRGLISVCCDGDSRLMLNKEESGRLQLAEWIASPSHPLTARVYVNRIWRHLFGSGLVVTTDNFGMMGQRPSHPELLDYLANSFVQNGWSTKKLIREIMLAHVYRLSAANDASAEAMDVSNRLLWRANRRRVDAEVLRDSILFVSGELDLTQGGLTIRKLAEYDLGYEFATVRRSVYVPAFRNSMLDLFEVFDFANPNLVVGNRNTSTLPTQALYLMNSSMVIVQSRNAAKNLLQLEGLDNSQRVTLAYRQTLGRRPSEAELEDAFEFLESIEVVPVEDSLLTAWAGLYHALFASLDFRYVE